MSQTKLTESAVAKSRIVHGSPVFYGWIIMLVGTLGMIMTSPGQTFAVSIFIEHFIKDLGVSRSLVSTLYTGGTLVGSFVLPSIGRQIDRRGPRLMVTVISIVFGAACIYMGFVSNAIMLGLGFVAIRMFGQGSLSLVSSNVINQWWVRKRGTVMGMSGVLVSLIGLGGFPNLINHMIPVFGWRTTYMLLGLGLLIIMAPIGLLLFRDKPEDYGLLPDGGSGQEKEKRELAPLNEIHWTSKEATHTFSFWSLAAGQAAIGMLTTGLFFHMVSIFDDNGLTAAIAASVYLPVAVTTAVVNMGSGMLVSRIPVRMLLAAALVFQASSLLLAQSLQSVQMAMIYGVILGTTSGLMGTVNSVAWASYFGRRHLGNITGIAVTVMVAGSALGPMPLGIARDILGSYNAALSLFAILPLVLAVFAFFARPPQLASTTAA